MSYQAVQWAMDDAPMLRMPKSGLADTTARAVLIARAERADEDGRDSHAGIEDVVWRTGFDERTIQNAERRLEAAGLMIRDGVTHWGTPRWNMAMTLRRDPAERDKLVAEGDRKRAAHADRERSRRATKAAANTPREELNDARAYLNDARAESGSARAYSDSPEPPVNLPGTTQEPPTGGTLPPDPLRPEPASRLRTDQTDSLLSDQDQPLETASNYRPHTRENEDTAPLPTTVASPAQCPHGRRINPDGTPRCKVCPKAPPVEPDTTLPSAPGPCGTPGCIGGVVLVGEVLQHCPGNHPQVEPAAPRPHRGPAPDDQVWIAIPRKGVEAHRPLVAEPTTACRRSMRTGTRLKASEATTRHKAHWCLTCWAPTESETP